MSLDLKVRQAALYIAAIVVYNLPNFKNQYTVYMEKESTQQKDHNSISWFHGVFPVLYSILASFQKTFTLPQKQNWKLSVKQVNLVMFNYNSFIRVRNNNDNEVVVAGGNSNGLAKLLQKIVSINMKVIAFESGIKNRKQKQPPETRGIL